MSTTTTILNTTPMHSHNAKKASDSADTSSSANIVNIHVDDRLKTDAALVSQRVLAPSSGTQSLHEGAQNFDSITPKMRRYEMVVFAAMSFALFLAGWNDGTVGPLLPRIQEVYGVGYAVVSVIFICACIGFVTGSLANVYLTDRYNLGLLMIGASACQVVAYAILAAAPPYPLFCIAFMINGFGISIQDAQANSLVASFSRSPNEKMGVLHAVYGLGAFAAPLSATQFAQIPKWSFHFLMSLGIALLNTLLLFVTVKGHSLEAILKGVGSSPPETRTADMELSNTRPVDGNSSSETGEVAPAPPSKSSMNQILRNVTVQLMAVFIFVYVGVEVTIGGWIVTFIISERGGGPSSGYISSGFFGGLMVGRVALLWLNKKVGERRVVFGYALLAIGLEVVIWLVPHLIGNAVAISIIGVLLGPMYPICINHAGRIIPRNILSGSIGWIAGFGQAGSAVLPFITGALASQFGIVSLQPLLVSMMAFMTILWALVPGHSKRRD
ncbi:hypothetical protein M408DRAFT_21744 [Serendipita vermifera MAFF 305830]|uniref:Major facilitator superfamily (MFS) profile domain-containing protein n=1 Tax=Serendipita vermifera MAFF 305830 TaxID=933852 RepID=A0A0C3B268_SERVB|nr:hypothetical protein M408DRAFT_21744 [Serendipita vermifera MAFF 305830]